MPGRAWNSRAGGQFPFEECGSTATSGELHSPPSGGAAAAGDRQEDPGRPQSTSPWNPPALGVTSMPAWFPLTSLPVCLITRPALSPSPSHCSRLGLLRGLGGGFALAARAHVSAGSVRTRRAPHLGSREPRLFLEGGRVAAVRGGRACPGFPRDQALSIRRPARSPSPVTRLGKPVRTPVATSRQPVGTPVAASMTAACSEV